MPRPPRLEVAGVVYHVFNRGNNRETVFRGPADAQDFLARFAEIAAALEWRCFGYCLMTNHYHLVLRLTHANLAAGMKALSAGYTQAFNRRHQRDGHVFRGRYQALAVEEERYLVTLLRYVELNPVLAGLNAEPGAWRWSSYKANAGLVPAPDFLDRSWRKGFFGDDDAKAGLAWRAAITAQLDHLDRVREVEAQLRRRAVLGSPAFRSRLEKGV